MDPTERFAVIRAIPETGRKYRFAGRGVDGQALPWTDEEVTVKIVPRQEDIAAFTDPKTGTSFWVNRVVDGTKKLVPRFERPQEVTLDQLDEIKRDRRITVRISDGQDGDKSEEVTAKIRVAELERLLDKRNLEFADEVERALRQHKSMDKMAVQQGERIRELETQLAQALAGVGDRAGRAKK